MLTRLRMIRSVLLFAGLLLATPVRAEVQVAVERISFDQSPSSEVLVARLHTTGRVRAYSVDQDGGTLELVLYRTEISPSLQRAVARMPVRSYRVNAGDDEVRILFDVDPSVNVRAYPDRESADLLLSFSTAPRPRAMAWGGGVVRSPGRDRREPHAVPRVGRGIAREAGGCRARRRGVSTAGRGRR